MEQKTIILVKLLVSVYNKLLHQIKVQRDVNPEIYMKSDTAHQHIADISRRIELMVSDMRKELISSHNDLQILGYSPRELPISSAPGISVDINEKSVRIIMDGMLPFPLKGSVYYLHQKLDTALEQLIQRNELPRPLFSERCAVVFIHRYANTPRSLRHLRDYDNVERRCVTNVIARHFMKDDSPACYISMDILAPGEDNHTEVRIMPISDFRAFVMSEQIDFGAEGTVSKNTPEAYQKT